MLNLHEPSTVTNFTASTCRSQCLKELHMLPNEIWLLMLVGWSGKHRACRIGSTAPVWVNTEFLDNPFCVEYHGEV